MTVAVAGLTFTYEGEPRPAIADVTLRTGESEFCLVSGASGSGKSTLGLALCGFIPHSYAGHMDGRVLINGLDTREHSIYRLATEIGLVQQDPEAQLCTLLVEDEVAFGPENLGLPAATVNERVAASLQAVNAEHLRHRATYTLSGGEKQKVAIASILAMEPKAIVLDEPTASLDPEATQQVLAAISAIRERTSLTTIVFEHRLEYFGALADRLLVMADGRVAVDGSAESLLTDAETLKRFSVRCPGATSFTTRELSPGAAVLEVEGLSLRYGERNILDSLDLELRAGEITALVGDNGSGKTSLLLSLLGVTEATCERLLIEKQDATAWRPSRRAKRLGVVLQNPNHQIFERTVLAEMLVGPKHFGLPQETCQKKAVLLLARFGLEQYRDRSPFSLSYGEKRRLNVAAATMSDPAVLLLDEPFIGQDLGTSQELMALLQEQAAQGRSILFVVHDPEMIAGSDRVLYLQDGKLQLDAPPHEAFTRLAEMGKGAYIPRFYWERRACRGA